MNYIFINLWHLVIILQVFAASLLSAIHLHHVCYMTKFLPPTLPEASLSGKAGSMRSEFKTGSGLFRGKKKRKEKPQTYMLYQKYNSHSSFLECIQAFFTNISWGIRHAMYILYNSSYYQGL